uniref:Uncharacterized protein n=1 Tax=Oryza barthii TaxID=65489 RepID=A0A0D3FQ72_9ORYZ
MADSCVFLRWPSTLPSLLGYRSLDDSKVAGLSSPAVEKECVLRRPAHARQLPIPAAPREAVRKEESKATLFIDVAILFLSVLCAKYVTIDT